MECGRHKKCNVSEICERAELLCHTAIPDEQPCSNMTRHHFKMMVKEIILVWNRVLKLSKCISGIKKQTLSLKKNKSSNRRNTESL